MMYPSSGGGLIPQTTSSSSSSSSTTSQSSHMQHHNLHSQQQGSFGNLLPSFSLQQQHGQLHHGNHHHQQHMHLQHHLDPGLMNSSHLPLAQQTSLINNAGALVPKQELVTPVPEIDKEKEKQARENHCEIERRRRVKMAAYFNELCVMVPTCNTLQRKPDKLTILRMASSHMRNLRGNNAVLANNSISTNDNNNAYKPSFLTDQELKHLILEAADGFLFVSQCDTGNIIYVSDAIKPVLSYQPNEWSNRSLFDFIHPDDLDKVRDQLSTLENSSNNSTGRILDLKTGTVKKEGHPNSMRSHIGSRRSFICRVKLGLHTQQHSNHRQIMDPNAAGFWSTSNARLSRNRNTLQSNIDLNDQQQQKANYSVIHITGYTKVWPPNQSTTNQNSNNMYQNDPATNTNFHLIAIARIQMTSAPTDLINSTNAEFVSRHDQNGVITFVDQRVTALLGYQPSEILKKPIYDYCIAQDQQMFKEQLKLIYETKITQPVQMTLHLMASNSLQNEIIQFKTSAYAFCNPCNDAFEFIVCTHTCQKFNDLNNSNLNTNFNLTSQCNNNVALNDANTNDTLQYNHYHNLHHYNNNSQLQPMNNYSNQYQYQQSNLNNNNVGNSSINNPNGSYGSYLMMQNMNSNSIENYNTLVSNTNSNTTPNTGISSSSSSSSSTPVSSATGNINQTLSPSNIAPTSTTPNTTAPSSSSSTASNTSNLTILQQRSSNLPLSNTANTWSNPNAANTNPTGYVSVDEY